MCGTHMGPMVWAYVPHIPFMFISYMWDVKEPTHYLRGVGHEVPRIVAVLCGVGWGHSNWHKAVVVLHQLDWQS